jgi:proteasome lid subunit RPN8/RPN11
MDPLNGVRAKVKTENTLVVGRNLFERTLRALQERSSSGRESAAIWVGKIDPKDSWIAERVYYHHELCDDRATALSLELTEAAKFRLYQELAKENRQLIALVHTHPEDWVGLSWIDRKNQISSRVGFWSIVIPWYGREPWNAEKMGVHVRSDPGWHRLNAAEVLRRFIIRDED